MLIKANEQRTSLLNVILSLELIFKKLKKREKNNNGDQ
jgi:hypothetical protein